MHSIMDFKNISKKQSIPKSLKRQVWCQWIGREKGIAKCLCCNVVDIEKDSFACGHIIAESKGGKLEVNNLKPVCMSCNSSMGTINMNDFIKKYNLHKYKRVTEKFDDESYNPVKNVYLCKCCKYYTEKLYCFKVHLLSKKHVDKAKISDDDETNKRISKTKIYCCNSCDKFYVSNQALQNHSNKCNNKSKKVIFKKKVNHDSENEKPIKRKK